MQADAISASGLSCRPMSQLPDGRRSSDIFKERPDNIFIFMKANLKYCYSSVICSSSSLLRLKPSTLHGLIAEAFIRPLTFAPPGKRRPKLTSGS